MTVNQAWRDAMTEAGRAFNPEEQKAGWPQTMTPWQLASLQRPFANGDKQGMTACHALFHGIEDDCKAGAIQHTAEIKEKVTPGRFIETASNGPNWTAGRWGFDSTRTGHYKPPTVKQWTDRNITARAFAEWLAAQEIEPSQHVSAWFKSQGVTAAKATPVPAPAAQVEPVQPPAPAGLTKETAEQRQERRYQMCIDAGLKMPDNDYAALPRGIVEIAKRESITRQSLAEDLKAYIRKLHGR